MIENTDIATKGHLKKSPLMLEKKMHEKNPSATEMLWVSILLKVAGAGFIAFFSFLTLAVFVDTGPTIESLIQWGEKGEAYELMIASIYIVWGIFLWRASANPLAHRMFLDFSVIANAVHFSVMLLEGIVMPHEHAHLHGDIALAWAGFIPMAVLWWRVRNQAR